MKKIFVTGGTGFIGSHLVNFLSKDYKVIVLDKFIYPNKIKKFNRNMKVIKGDIRDYNLIKKHSKDCVGIFHLAAVLGIDVVAKKHLETMETEFYGIKNICKVAVENNIKKIVYTSTSGVYGKQFYNIIPDENKDVAPSSSYAIAKRNAEFYLKYFSQKYKIDCTAVRLFNVYGPAQDNRMVIPRIFDWAKKNSDIIIYNNGKQTRDFTYIDDCVQALFIIFKKLKGFNILNVAKGKDTKIIDLAKIIKKMVKSKSKIVLKKIPDSLTEFEVKKRCGNSNKLYKKTGFRPKTTLKKGLEKTFNNLQN